MRPEIGFKGFADEWEQHKLSEICDFEKGKGLSKDDISDNGKYPCILYGIFLNTCPATPPIPTIIPACCIVLSG